MYKNLSVNILYGLTSILILCHGFASKSIFGMAVLGLLILSFIHAIKEQKKNKICFTAILFAIAFLFPNITVLYGFLALIFSANNRTQQYIITPAFLASLELFGITPSTYFQICVLFVINLLVGYCFRNSYKILIPSIRILCIVAIISTIASFSAFKAQYSIEKYSDSVYSPSELFSKITEAPLKELSSISDEDFVIRSNSFYTKIPKANPGIIINDIDHIVEDPLIYNQRWQQPVCWNNNLFLGNQYFVEAIYNDKALWSNIGLCLSETPKTLLSFPLSFYKSQSLITLNHQTMYLHDSDYTTSFLANYQSSFIKELTNNNGRPNYIRIINIIFFLIAILSLGAQQRTIKYSNWGLLITIILLALPELYPTSGELRMCGDILNSHENETFDSVPKKLVENGYNYTIGKKNCKVLVIKSGKTAKWKHESLIVAEPNSTLIYGKTKMHVDDLPLGRKDDIYDARNWYVNGERLGPFLENNDITFIATGSPGLLPWREYIK